MTPASAGNRTLCISFGDLAMSFEANSCHGFVMRHCDTVLADMIPLHESVLETPLSPLPQSARDVASVPRRFFSPDGQSRPRDAIDTGSPLPITR